MIKVKLRPQGYRTNLSPDERKIRNEEMIQLYKEGGWSQDAIGKKFGISKATVGPVLRKAGVALRHREHVIHHRAGRPTEQQKHERKISLPRIRVLERGDE